MRGHFHSPKVKLKRFGLSSIKPFAHKHPDLDEIFAEHFAEIRGAIPAQTTLSAARKFFIGACFTMEYALESVALFNPSIVPGLIQEGVPPGSVRFLMSLRAIGEGHLSSIVFRTGIIDANGDVQLDAAGSYSKPLKATVPDQFQKSTFKRDLAAMGVPLEHFQRILDRLDEHFTRSQLSDAIEAAHHDQQSSGFLEETADTLIAVTRVNHQLHLPSPPPVVREVEIVIFPFSDIERHGIEDLRMVRFAEDDGSHVYYGTFTAYDGGHIFPQLMEYRGGSTMDISLMTGDSAQQGHGALSPADSREIRNNLADRQREPVLHGIR